MVASSIAQLPCWFKIMVEISLCLSLSLLLVFIPFLVSKTNRKGIMEQKILCLKLIADVKEHTILVHTDFILKFGKVYKTLFVFLTPKTSYICYRFPCHHSDTCIECFYAYHHFDCCCSTYIIFTRIANADVINIIGASTSNSRVMHRIIAQ